MEVCPALEVCGRCRFGLPCREGQAGFYEVRPDGTLESFVLNLDPDPSCHSAQVESNQSS